jgi:hypothetical protein
MCPILGRFILDTLYVKIRTFRCRRSLLAFLNKGIRLNIALNDVMCDDID